MIEIEIKSVTIPMFLGIYEYEKTLERDVIFDLKFNCNINILPRNDIYNLLNYDLVIKQLTHYFYKAHYDLIEDVIYDAINLVKSMNNVLNGNIKVTKTKTHINASQISISSDF